MRALRHIQEVPASAHGSLESLLARFSTITLELNPSLGTAEFARRLTAQAAEMFGARAAALSLRQSSREQGWAIAALTGPARRWEKAVQERLAAVLAEHASAPAVPLRSGNAARLLGSHLAEALEWQEIVIARLTGSEGELQGVLCLVDLGRALSNTERRLLEALAGHASVALENVRMFARIERSRKQWVQDIDAISDFLVVHDASGRVLRLNRALADMLGVRPAEAVGKDIGALELLGSTAQAEKCPFCRNSQAASEEFVQSASERTYLISTSRLSSEEDEARTIHVLKDITDRREAERRYRRERDFNRNILNNTQSMIVVLDTAGLVSYANRRCFEAGYAEREIVGHPLAEKVSPARRAIFAEALDRALQGATVDSIEIPFVRGNGAAAQFSLSLSPMRDDQRNINSIVVVMTDVTGAADLQAKLMHTEKMAALGQLVSGVAHEVNNPLAAIVGFTDLLLENPKVPREAKEELAVILQEAQRTRVIVQNLLSFARQMPPQREPVRMNSILRQTLKLRAYDLSSLGVEIVERYDEDLPLTIGDPHQLQQVLLNILNNAYDAIQEVKRPGRIEISTSHSAGQIEIAFRDNGPGIAHPERIFDPFFTTKEVGKGTGLGLSICYGIIRAHQGEIVAQNSADGVGCTFLVRLPLAAKAVEMLVAETVP